MLDSSGSNDTPTTKGAPAADTNDQQRSPTNRPATADVSTGDAAAPESLVAVFADVINMLALANSEPPGGPPRTHPPGRQPLADALRAGQNTEAQLASDDQMTKTARDKLLRHLETEG
ncbi:MAG: hypothetical protein ACHQ4H_12140 [Ktedonobacterales bacterium]